MGDLYVGSGNIFINPTTFEISCIIDWELASPVPIEALCVVPQFANKRRPMEVSLQQKFIETFCEITTQHELLVGGNENVENYFVSWRKERGLCGHSIDWFNLKLAPISTMLFKIFWSGNWERIGGKSFRNIEHNAV